MNTDIRIHIEFFDHAKLRRMLRELGPWGPLSLLRLWTYAAKNRANGVLSGMNADDIEDRSGWSIDQPERGGEFFRYITRNRWLDKVGRGVWKIHEWEVYNPWAADAEDRARDGRRGAHERHHVKKGISRPRTCEFCRELLGGLPKTIRRGSYAPAPSPNPAPSPSPAPVARERETSSTDARARAKEAQSRDVSRWLKEHPGVIQCLHCAPHAPHAPGRCPEVLRDRERCYCAEEGATRLSPNAAVEFENHFQFTWDEWCERRSGLREAV